MLKNQKLITHLDWEVGEEEFRHQVLNLVKATEDNGKSIPLPIKLQTGEPFMGQLAMMLAAVDCKDCGSICCRRSMDPEDLGIGIIGTERAFFEARGCQMINRKEIGWHMPYPCNFVSYKKGSGCTIYNDRPFSCILFPFQPGGAMGEHGEIAVVSINALCPEGKRLAEFIYMTVYRIKSKVNDFMRQGI